MVSNVAPIGPAGNLRQAPATLIGAVPGQELDLDSRDLLAPARTEVLEERDHLPVPQLPAQRGSFSGIGAVELEDVLGRVHADAANLFHGWPPHVRFATT
jgi:hypothetical protein